MGGKQVKAEGAARSGCSTACHRWRCGGWRSGPRVAAGGRGKREGSTATLLVKLVGDGLGAWRGKGAREGRGGKERGQKG